MCWLLDTSKAWFRRYPGVGWRLYSFSTRRTVLESFFETINPEFYDMSNRALKLLQVADDLTEIVQLVGIVSLTNVFFHKHLFLFFRSP